MVIDSTNGCYRAILDDDHPDGVNVIIWKRAIGERGWKAAYATTVDAPFHLVCDLVHDLVEVLHPADAQTTMSARLRLVSVDGRRIER